MDEPSYAVYVRSQNRRWRLCCVAVGSGRHGASVGIYDTALLMLRYNQVYLSQIPQPNMTENTNAI